METREFLLLENEGSDPLAKQEHCRRGAAWAATNNQNVSFHKISSLGRMTLGPVVRLFEQRWEIGSSPDAGQKRVVSFDIDNTYIVIGPANGILPPK